MTQDPYYALIQQAKKATPDLPKKKPVRDSLPPTREQMLNRGITTNKSAAIENWIVDTLLLHYKDTHRSQILDNLGISKPLLRAKSIPPENVERIFAGLFVYSKGFNELLNQTLDGDILVKAQLWKVFVTLLEFYNTSNYKGVLDQIMRRNDEVQQEQKKYLDKLLEEIEKEKRRKEEQEEEWVGKADELENEIIRLNQQVKSENAKFQAAEEAHNAEFQKRMKMELKQSQINDIYDELKYKHELLMHNFARSQKSLNLFLQKVGCDSQLTHQKEEMASKEMRLTQDIASLKHCVGEAKERIMSLEHECTRKNQTIEFMEKKVKEYERHIEETTCWQQQSESAKESTSRNMIIYESQIGEMKALIARLEQENQQLSQLNSHSHLHNTRLLQQLSQLENSQESATQLRREYSSQLEALQTENEELKARSSQLRSKKDQVPAIHPQLSKYKTQTKALQNQYDLLKTKFDFSHDMAHTLGDNQNIQILTNKQLLMANQNLKYQLEKSQEEELHWMEKHKKLNESYLTLEEHIVKQGNVFFQQKQVFEKALDEKDSQIRRLHKENLQLSEEINALNNEFAETTGKIAQQLEAKSREVQDVHFQNNLLLQQLDTQQTKQQFLLQQYQQGQNRKAELEEKHQEEMEELQRELHEVRSEYQQLQQQHEETASQNQYQQAKLRQLEQQNESFEKQLVHLQGVEIEFDHYKEKAREQIKDLQRQVQLQQENHFINQQKLRERQSVIDVLQQKQDSIHHRSYIQESQLLQLRNKELQLQSENLNLKKRLSRQSILFDKTLSKTAKRTSKLTSIHNLIGKQADFTKQMEGIFAQLENLVQEDDNPAKIKKYQRKNFRRSQSFVENDLKPLQINESSQEDSPSSDSMRDITSFDVSQKAKSNKTKKQKTNHDPLNQRETRAKSQLIDIADTPSDPKNNNTQQKQKSLPKSRASKRLRTSIASTSQQKKKEEWSTNKEERSRVDTEAMQRNFQEMRESLIHQRVSLQFQRIGMNNRKSMVRQPLEGQSPEMNKSSYLSQSQTTAIPPISRTTVVVKKPLAKSASKEKQVEANEFKRIYRLATDYYTKY